MGAIHNELRKGVFSKALKDALGVEQTEAGLERFSESLQPVIDLWSRPEWSLLRGERLWIASPSQTAVAGEFQQVGIRNPRGSDALVVVQDLLMGSNLTKAVQVRLRAVQVPDDIDAHGAVQSRDMRTPGQLGLRTQGLANSVAGAPLGSFLIQRLFIPASWPNWVSLGVVLSPGFDLLVGVEEVNLEDFVSFRGYERTAFPGELETRS